MKGWSAIGPIDLSLVAVEDRGDVRHPHRPKPYPINLHQRLQPVHPPARNPLHRAARRLKRRRHRIRAAGQRQRVVGDAHRRHAASISLNQRGLVQPRMDRIARPRRRADAAQAKAIDRLQPHPLARCCLCRRHQRLDPARLAGLGPAQLHLGARIGLGAKS